MTNRLTRAASLTLALAACLAAYGQEKPIVNLVFCCEEGNDLYRVVSRTARVDRFDNAVEAVANAPEGAGVLVLADGYPDKTTPLDQALFDAAAAKNLRLYVEFPSWLPGIDVGKPQSTKWERAAVASDAFGPDLARLRIMAIHDCTFMPVDAPNPDIVVARIAGFDTAVYGLPEDGHPILFRVPESNVVVSTTKLSQFLTARYAPSDAWRTIIPTLLGWLTDADLPDLDWTATVRPSFSADEALPDNVESEALRRGVDWFFNAKLLPAPSWTDDRSEWHDSVGPVPEPDWPVGDGGMGLLEGFSSAIRCDGSQYMRWWLRNDCMGEGMMALAFNGVVDGDARSRDTAKRLGDFVYFESPITKGLRDDPKSDSYGLMSWDMNKSLGVFYGDDNARGLLGSLACAALVKTDVWDEKMLRCLLANLRTTGPQGFRNGRIDEGPLRDNGWKHFFTTPRTHYAPHYECYLWACYLWAYDQTGYELFLERAKTGIRMTMEVYPDEWHWTNGLQQERARMLLPLAWLVRVEDTPQHREWLRFMAGELLAHQAECGAIREQLGEAGKGSYGPPASNEAYGTSEAPLIQANGDPLCDLLYTSNFAFIGLHEAARATGDAYYAEAEDKLAKFFCRIQIRSEAHPELDGGWFRAFDFDRWEYWASNADLGWGAWSIESGWTCGWLNAVLGMREMDTSLWDLTADSQIERHLGPLVKTMMSDLPEVK